MELIQPWVGKHYEDGVLGKRVLLLGESNYDKSETPADDYSGIVRENVEDCVFKGSARFFTKVARIVLMATGAGHSSRDEVRGLWQHVAFTNYIQKIFRSDRVRPSDDDWPAGKAALSKQLTEHNPQVIIVMGLELASHLEWLSSLSPHLAMATIAHPSSFGFKYDQWVPRVKEAFVAPGAGLEQTPPSVV